jgi:outer membrane protein OmpA-like peptidoglycan-associated protein
MTHAPRFVLAAALFAWCAVPGISAAQDTTQDTTTEATPDAVAAAEAAVETARAALEKAMADGTGIEEARAALQKALDDLAAAREAAGLPPLPPEEMTVPPAPEATPAEPAPETQPAPEETPQPAPDENAQPAPTEQPAPTDQPAPTEQPQPTEPSPEATPAPEQPAPAEPAPEQPGVEEPAPPPPPAASDENFDLNKFKERPKFGEMPPPPKDLPPSADAIPEGATVVVPGGRTIEKRDGDIVIRHDDANRVRQQGDNVTVVNGPNGTTTETIHRRNGIEIVTVRDRDGNILQRFRKNPDGSIVPLIGPPPQNGDVAMNPPPPPPPRQDFNIDLGPLHITIPNNQYVVDSSKAGPQVLENTLAAPPVEPVERAYSLDEVRNSDRLRAKVRRVDFDTITFNTGQATVPDDQIQRMEVLGRALRALIDRDPSQVFLIEGHTDAIGSDLYNLALSDRRAETVAQILTYYFDIPPENLVTQGYGERFLKVPTADANRENRRVAIRNITYLLGSR